MGAAALATAGALALMHCGRGGGLSSKELVVLVRTDFVAGVDFSTIQTTLAGNPPQVYAATAGQDFLTGAEVARFTTAVDASRIFVSLMATSGPAVTRQVALRMEGAATTAVVTITRDCSGVGCPGNAPSCLGGRCVVETCSSINVNDCQPVCARDSDCAPAACATGYCSEGACLIAPIPGACPTGACDPVTGCGAATPDGGIGDGGLGDASVDGGGTDGAGLDGAGDANCECTVGEMQTDMEACGNCGMLERTRTCAATCQWNEWMNGECMGEGVCMAGAMQMMQQTCQNGKDSTGTRSCTRQCGDLCTWGSFTCQACQ